MFKKFYCNLNKIQLFTSYSYFIVPLFVSHKDSSIRVQVAYVIFDDMMSYEFQFNFVYQRFILVT